VRETPADLHDLYVGSYARLVSVVAAVCGSRDEAEEAVQAAFVRLVAAWSRVSAYDDPEAWVRKAAFGIVSNRRRKVRNGVRALLKQGPSADVAGPSGDAVDLARALATLPAAQRQALVLVHVVGLSIDAAARELGCAPGTVKSRLSRGRAALTPLLSDEQLTEEESTHGPT
jgi:RNA polymerase sigma-70 factor (ECF subfamily)